MTSAPLSGRLSSYDNRGMRSGNPRTANQKLYAACGSLARRFTEQGFPIEAPFKSNSEIKEYLGGERIVCLRCGKTYKALNGHLRLHGWTADEYKQFYGLPWRCALARSETIETKSRIGKALFKQGLCLGALSEDARRESRGMAQKASKRNSPAKLMSSLENIAIANGGRSISEEGYWRTLSIMHDEDKLLNEVLPRDGLPGKSRFYDRLRCDPEFAKRYRETNEALSFVAQARGECLGDRFRAEVKKLRSAGKSYHEAASILGVSAMTALKHVREEKGR